MCYHEILSFACGHDIGNVFRCPERLHRERNAIVNWFHVHDITRFCPKFEDDTIRVRIHCERCSLARANVVGPDHHAFEIAHFNMYSKLLGKAPHYVYLTEPAIGQYTGEMYNHRGQLLVRRATELDGIQLERRPGTDLRTAQLEYFQMRERLHGNAPDYYYRPARDPGLAQLQGEYFWQPEIIVWTALPNEFADRPRPQPAAPPPAVQAVNDRGRGVEPPARVPVMQPAPPPYRCNGNAQYQPAARPALDLPAAYGYGDDAAPRQMQPLVQPPMQARQANPMPAHQHAVAADHELVAADVATSVQRVEAWDAPRPSPTYSDYRGPDFYRPNYGPGPSPMHTRESSDGHDEDRPASAGQPVQEHAGPSKRQRREYVDEGAAGYGRDLPKPEHAPVKFLLPTPKPAAAKLPQGYRNPFAAPSTKATGMLSSDMKTQTGPQSYISDKSWVWQANKKENAPPQQSASTTSQATSNHWGQMSATGQKRSADQMNNCENIDPAKLARPAKKRRNRPNRNERRRRAAANRALAAQQSGLHSRRDSAVGLVQLKIEPA